MEWLSRFVSAVGFIAIGVIVSRWTFGSKPENGQQTAEGMEWLSRFVSAVEFMAIGVIVSRWTFGSKPENGQQTTECKTLKMKRKRNSEEASTSNCLPSSEPTSRNYDVFLSFRGPDARDKFTSHLYERLTSVGFSVFKDDVEMVIGEGIGEALKMAIDNSTICMPIFSKGYAASKACLQELYHMVQEHKSIIPIFYDVGPDDVKLKTDLYKKDLEVHRQQGKGGVEKWEKALLEVGKILGPCIANKNEADAITEITRKVLNQLRSKFQVVPSHFVEIDDQVKSVIRMLDLNSDGCRFIGLCGMGGIGKTTLAKVVFNHLSANFDNSCSFIANVRENVEDKALLKLLRQLYKDLIDPNCAKSIDNINDGVNMIRKGLNRKKKFLLVLDDVDDGNLLPNFLGDSTRLADGSRIIITTRNKRVLDALEMGLVQQRDNDRALVKVYQVQKLDNDRALELFSRFSFRSDTPPRQFESLSKKLASSLGGLPLALKVIGSSMLGHSEKAWEEAIKKLEESPNEKIQSALMISYNGLSKEEKKIFLDIACYPGGLKKMEAYYMWTDLGWCPNLSTENLINKSLVVTDVVNGKTELLSMHDVLKDLGRDIIRKQRKGNGSKVRRFLQIDDINVDKIANEERKYVEMLRVDCKTITSEDLLGFENVRLLELFVRQIKGCFEGLFPNLRWILICGVEHFMATNFNPANLVVLQLDDVEKKDIHYKCCQMKAHKLQVLNLSVFYVKELPEATRRFKELRVLSIAGGDITKFPTAIGSLTSLEELEISGCEDFDGHIPSEISMCSCLKILKLSSTPVRRMSKLPPSLTHLLIDSPTRIELYPHNLHELVNIVELRLSFGCEGIFSYALYDQDALYDQVHSTCLDFQWICKAPMLEKLHLCIPCVITGWENVYGLSLLKELTLSFVKLQDHLQLPPMLSLLTLNYCNFPCGILDVSHAKKMEVLKVSYCCSLREIRGLAELDFLRELELEGCNLLGEYPEGSELDNLSTLAFVELKSLKLSPASKSGSLSSLTIRDCKNLECIYGLDGLEPLTNLSIRRCPSLKEFPKLSNLRNLSSLQLWSCKNLKRIVGFDGLKSLTKLSIEHCPSLEEFPNLSNLRNLSSLNLCSCKNPKRIVGFDGLESLTDLSITDCPSLEEFPKLSNLRNLSSLNLWNCKNSRNCKNSKRIVGFDGLESLTHLSIAADCPSLEEFPKLSNLRNLSSLELQNCKNLKRIVGFDGLESLTRLSIRNCPSLEEFPKLSNLRNLSELTLGNCKNLKRIVGFDGLESLTDLSIRDCPSLEEFPNLSNLRNLFSLQLRSCKNPKRIVGFDGLESLTHFLYIEDCPSLEEFPKLSNLRNLSSLNLWNCKNSKRIVGFDGLESLIDLSIRDCPSLEEFPKLSNLRNLSKLTLENCKNVKRIVGFDGLESLTRLSIRDCPSLEEFPKLSNMRNLSKLTLENCKNLKRIVGFDGLESLTDLSITDCPSLEEFPELSNLRNLSSLELRNCKNRKRIVGFDGLEYLIDLSIRDCPSLEEFPELSNLRNLSSLKLRNCKNPKRIVGFDGLESLTDLSIRDCPSLEEVPKLSNLRNLSSLKLRNCKNLKRIVGFDGLESLTKLSIRDCPSLEEFPKLSDLRNLSSLELWRCKNLKRIVGFDGPESLTFLSIIDCPSEEFLKLSNLRNLSSLLLTNWNAKRIVGFDELEHLIVLSITGCPSLEEFPKLSNLRNLSKLTLENCKNLKRIVGFDGLESLTRLSIRDCPSLEEFPKLSNLRRLRKLHLHNCKNLKGKVRLDGLKTLSILEIQNLGIDSLELVGCGKLVTMESLTDLSICNCPSLSSLSDLFRWGNLKRLTLRECKGLEQIGGLTQLKSLEEVHIIQCQSLKLDPNDLSKLRNTRRVRINISLSSNYFDESEGNKAQAEGTPRHILSWKQILQTRTMIDCEESDASVEDEESDASAEDEESDASAEDEESDASAEDVVQESHIDLNEASAEDVGTRSRFDLNEESEAPAEDVVQEVPFEHSKDGPSNTGQICFFDFMGVEEPLPQPREN